MTIFDRLLKEALELREGIFENEEELIKKIKSILRKSSIPKHKETKVNSEKGFSFTKKYGYRYTYLHETITITFPLGTERVWIGEITKELTKADIIFHYNEKQEIFMIKVDENVKTIIVDEPEEITDETIEEE